MRELQALLLAVASDPPVESAGYRALSYRPWHPLCRRIVAGVDRRRRRLALDAGLLGSLARGSADKIVIVDGDGR